MRSREANVPRRRSRPSRHPPQRIPECARRDARAVEALVAHLAADGEGVPQSSD